MNKKNQAYRTLQQYNIDLLQPVFLSSDYEIPRIEKERGLEAPVDMIPFNFAKNFPDKHVCVHFFIDDYQFERLWRMPQRYLSILKQYNCVCTPDFSLYTDMPLPLQLWNVYRSRFIGQWLQREGIKVIPTLQWADETSYKFCFQGIVQGSTVAVSTLGADRYKETKLNWKRGIESAILSIRPKNILVYGNPIEFDSGDCNVVYYNNHIIERIRKH